MGFTSHLSSLKLISHTKKKNLKEFHRKIINFLFSFDGYLIYSDVDSIKKSFSKKEISEILRKRGAVNIILKPRKIVVI